MDEEQTKQSVELQLTHPDEQGWHLSLILMVPAGQVVLHWPFISTLGDWQDVHSVDVGPEQVRQLV